MNSDKLDWFYNLPTKKGSYWLVAPRAFEGDFVVKVTFTHVMGQHCFLVEPSGKDWLLGLIFFFKCFTEVFETGELGNSGGEDPSPFFVSFPNGSWYSIFKEAIQVANLNLNYTPIIRILNLGWLRFYYFV